MKQNKTKKPKYIVYYNKQSTNYEKLDEWVRTPLSELAKKQGRKVIYIEVKPVFDDTIKAIASEKRISDGDIVAACGGDGTLSAVLNGLVVGNKKVNLLLMPLGKCNDTLGSMGKKSLTTDIKRVLSKKPIPYMPIEMLINGKHAYWALHDFTVGHIANIGYVLNEASRKAKREGRKEISMLKLVMGYYFNEALPRPDGGLGSFVDENGEHKKFGILAVVLGRVGGSWYPRVDGRVVRSLHRGNDIAVLEGNLAGKSLVDIPSIVAWMFRGMNARMATHAVFNFDKPVKKMRIVVDGEIFNFKNVRKIEGLRRKSNLRLYVPSEK